jgi:Rrf2 family protein
MLVTRETDYAVRCVLYLARVSEKVASVAEISQKMLIPRSFLAKILQRLVREGLVESSRGAKGGFWLIKRPEDITLLEVFFAMQGVAPINSCAIDKRRCRLSEKCCVHPIWVEIRSDVEKRLAQQTIAGLIALE